MGKIITFTKGIHFKNKWNIVMVLVCSTFLWCDLSLSEVTSFYTLEVMPKTKIQSKNLQRAITPNIAGILLWFLHTAHLLNVIYLCVKSEVPSFYTLKVMPRTKIQRSKNLQRAITQKIDGIELWFLYTALVLNVIYLCVKFEVASFYILEVMSWTKTQSKNLQRAITW